jgi:pyruvate kinase
MDKPDIPELIRTIDGYLDAMRQAEQRMAPWIEKVQPHYRDSALNLVHYLRLRTFDLRPVQEQLSAIGISSISHSERYTLTNLNNVLQLLRLLQGESRDAALQGMHLGYPRSRQRSLEHTAALFGPPSPRGGARVMVTLPSESATDPKLIGDLVAGGVEILRINTGHDDTAAWEAMIGHIREAEAAHQRKVLVYMDLAGPKIRTGAIQHRITAKGRRKESRILLHEGERLEIWRDLPYGEPAHFSEEGELLALPRLGITLPELFGQVRSGDRIWFDDGKIGGVIEEALPHCWRVRITMTGPDGARLKAEKGINLPDSDLQLPSLTDADRRVLPFVAQHADMIGYSFVQNPEDVRALRAALCQSGREEVAIILKIETRRAFQQLPHLLLEGMRHPRLGVMIARGDLAVELGWSRIAEVQEEIAWLCEAAHIPYIWATQILDNLARTGLATRAEITDTVAAVRAECVMLNKGPFILKAVKTIRKINDRMLGHQDKKRHAMRPLQVALDYFGVHP